MYLIYMSFQCFETIIIFITNIIKYQIKNININIIEQIIPVLIKNISYSLVEDIMYCIMHIISIILLRLKNLLLQQQSDTSVINSHLKYYIF